jgi:hypothetical protein
MFCLCGLCVLCGEKFKARKDLNNFLYNKKLGVKEG